MAAGKRPGGLTALGVINLVFGIISVLGGISSLVFAPMALEAIQAEQGELSEDEQAFFELYQSDTFITLTALSVLVAVVMLVAGIGYLKQKKFMGWTMGNVYAVLSIASSLASAMALPSDMEGVGGFGIATIIGLVYPVLTLFLINTTFKEDLVN